MLLRPNKAQIVVFGCQCPVHKIVRSDYLMQNFSGSLPHERGITFFSETNLLFEREKRRLLSGGKRLPCR